MCDFRPVLSIFIFILGISLPQVGVTDEFTGTISAPELMTLLQAEENDFLLLDVRSPREYSQAHIASATNIPHTLLKENISTIEDYKNKLIIVYCRSGVRAGIASKILANAGFNKITHLSGDMNGWTAVGFPVEK